MNCSTSTSQLVRFAVAVVFAVLALGVLWAGVATAEPIAAPIGPERDSGSSLSDSPAITIGAGAMTSGYWASTGWAQVNAVQLAVNQANAAGGIKIGGTTYTLNLVVADSGCDATQGAAAATALLSQGAVAVVGYTCSSSSIGAQPLHAAAGVAMISPSSTNPLVTEQGYATTFRVISRDDQIAPRLPTYLRRWLRLERAAIVEREGFWGNWVNDSISATFTALGGTITSRRTVVSPAEFTATLAAIQPEYPDVIFYADGAADYAAQLSSAAHSLGMTSTIGWTTCTEDESVLPAYAAQAGAAAEGDYALMFYRRTQDMPGYAAFNVAYQAAGFPNYGDEATATGAFAYDAARIIIGAIKRAQSTSPGAIRDAIASTANYQGAVGTYRGFDVKGDVIPQWGWLERYTGGQWVALHPGHVFLPVTLR